MCVRVESPFAVDGGKPNEDVARMGKRKTILVMKHTLPYLKKRVEVERKEQRDLTVFFLFSFFNLLLFFFVLFSLFFHPKKSCVCVYARKCFFLFFLLLLFSLFLLLISLSLYLYIYLFFSVSLYISLYFLFLFLSFSLSLSLASRNKHRINQKIC